MENTTHPLLTITDLKTYFYMEEGIVKAVDGVSFSIEAGKTLCLVGESGCGKSITALSILGLIPNPPGKIISGSIYYKGTDLLTLPENKMRQLRGKEIAMVFQEPMTSLNPVFTIGYQIEEVLKTHKGMKGKELRERAIELLRLTHIPSPEQRINEYPHQLSGGMLQRVMIAMALSCGPSLLIADEPTTALDVTIQAEILDLINELQDTLKMAVLLITHDLGVVAETAHKVVVMYAGKIVEVAEVNDLFSNPLHPYTIGLFNSLPSISGSKKPLKPIPGNLPDPLHFPSGCAFHPRCFLKESRCTIIEPVLEEKSNNHYAACIMREPHECSN